MKIYTKLIYIYIKVWFRLKVNLKRLRKCLLVKCIDWLKECYDNNFFCKNNFIKLTKKNAMNFRQDIQLCRYQDAILYWDNGTPVGQPVFSCCTYYFNRESCCIKVNMVFIFFNNKKNRTFLFLIISNKVSNTRWCNFLKRSFLSFLLI